MKSAGKHKRDKKNLSRDENQKPIFDDRLRRDEIKKPCFETVSGEIKSKKRFFENRFRRDEIKKPDFETVSGEMTFISREIKKISLMFFPSIHPKTSIFNI